MVDHLYSKFFTISNIKFDYFTSINIMQQTISTYIVPTTSVSMHCARCTEKKNWPPITRALLLGNAIQLLQEGGRRPITFGATQQPEIETVIKLYFIYIALMI